MKTLLKNEYIPQYPWSNVLRVMANFSKRRKQISNDKHIYKVPYCEVDCLEDNKNIEVVADNLFSSY